MAKDVHRVANASDSRVVKNVDVSKFESFSKENAARAAAPDSDFRRKAFPIRTGLAAASLFALGSILIYVSTLIGLDEERRGLSFLILGLIAFIPGSYATYQLYGAWKGWKGYNYDQIPSYDD
ncbi:Transmembrane protein [Phytophthora megakarya]|uniref:Transmembrane protein 230 n=1 Tax=Phytophthora megakarya TaxID=4795 RepID=A0A225V8V3_9STRA|nr:Transmembrane protein [Phytophthora megakarya]